MSLCKIISSIHGNILTTANSDVAAIYFDTARNNLRDSESLELVVNGDVIDSFMCNPQFKEIQYAASH